MIKYVMKCAAVSWAAAITLGLAFGASVMHSVSLAHLWVTLVIQVSLIISSVVAVLVTPVTAWAFGGRISWVKLVGLWLVLLVYVSAVAYFNGPAAFAGSVLLALTGLFVIRRSSAQNRQSGQQAES